MIDSFDVGCFNRRHEFLGQSTESFREHGSPFVLTSQGSSAMIAGDLGQF